MQQLTIRPTFLSHPARTPKPTKSRAEIQRIFQGILHLSTMGGGPEMKDKRKERMDSLLLSTGRTSEEIEEVAKLIIDGGSIGARNKVDGWYTIK